MLMYLFNYAKYFKVIYATKIRTQTIKNLLMRTFFFFFAGSERNTSRTIIIIIVPIAAFVVLVISFCVYFRVKRRPRREKLESK